ncbi:CD3337/EF1877 family mobilome membrane protein [Fictibacillus phosphorivorans]|uniref:CD3337/EF1877 family mobilome membrane protein n=1 Tax=Fictibacillus phosphorivorans TaxID=1221500 RepID=UPI003CF90BE8
MHHLKRILILFVFLFLFLPSSTNANDPSPTVEKKIEKIGRIELEQSHYPLDHYKLEADIDDGIKATGDRALHSINAGLWSFNKVISSFTLYAVNQLMSFDLISLMVKSAGEMSERIYTIMVSTFLSLFIIIVGGTAAYRYYVNQQSGHAIKAIIGALVIMIFTFWFYEDTTGNIQQLNQWGSDIEGIASSANVLLTSDTIDGDKSFSAQEGTAVLQNQLFNLMVKRPYTLLNYGTTKEEEVNKEDPNRLENLLKIKPYNEEGKDARGQIVEREVRDFENKQMSPEYSGERFGYLIITIISTFSLAVPVILLSSFKFLLQVWFLALVIFTAIPLILSLIPSFSETALNHFKKIIGVLLMKGGLVLLTSVITGMATLVYESVKISNGIEGYAFVVFLIVLIIWGLMKYRSEIFEVASSGMVQGQQIAERMTFQAANAAGEVGEKGYSVAKRMTGNKSHGRNHQSKHTNSKNEQRMTNQETFRTDSYSNQSDKREPGVSKRVLLDHAQGKREVAATSQARKSLFGVVSLKEYKQDKKSEKETQQRKTQQPRTTKNNNSTVSSYRNPDSVSEKRAEPKRANYVVREERPQQSSARSVKHLTRYEAQKQIDARKLQENDNGNKRSEGRH